jgi:hypothetical protein
MRTGFSRCPEHEHGPLFKLFPVAVSPSRTIQPARSCTQTTVSDGPLTGVVGQSAFIDDIGSRPTGVDEMANAAGPRRVNDVVVLPHPLPRVGAEMNSS